MTAAPRPEAKRKIYRRRRVAAGIIAVLVLLGGYCAIIAATPLPRLSTTLSVEADTEFVADSAPAQAAVDAQGLPSATGWLHGEEVWSNSDDTFRIASLTKLITALVGLEAAPIAPGTDGPIYTLTEADAALVDEVLAQDGTFAPAPVGLELTTRQILDLILVPSANNYAISYARWIFGSDEAFLATANDWLTRNGLESVYIEDAAGLSDNNVATPADIVRLSRVALANPTVAEIVAQSVIYLPELGEITTTNRLLSDAGVIGLKTGTTFPNGHSLSAAQHDEIGGRGLVAIAVTMERPDSDTRAADTRAVLAAMAASGQPVQFAEQGARIGTVTTWTGDVVPLLTEADLSTALVPGESATRSVTVQTEAAASAQGVKIGKIAAVTPAGEEQVAVVTGAPVTVPNFWWRFTHPLELFGFSGVSS